MKRSMKRRINQPMMLAIVMMFSLSPQLGSQAEAQGTAASPQPIVLGNQADPSPYMRLFCFEDPNVECLREGFTMDFSLGTGALVVPELGETVYGMGFELSFGGFFSEDVALLLRFSGSLPIDETPLASVLSGPMLQLWHLEPLVVELGARFAYVSELQAYNDTSPVFASSGIAPSVGLSWVVPSGPEVGDIRMGLEYAPIIDDDGGLIHRTMFNFTFQLR